jgi:penicillin amidase
MSRWIRRGLLAALILGSIAVLGVWLFLRASLPQLDGEIDAAVASSTRIERDALGTAMIYADNRDDASYALGFVHAQERYFEMDLLRRRAAGELAALFGAAAIEADKSARVHRFRARSGEYLDALPAQHRRALQRYTEGVNAGLSRLSARPFAYALLQQTPEPWREEDGLLATLAMYFNLQDASNSRELKLERMRHALPASVFAWLAQAGSRWDAPLRGARLPAAPLPSPADIDLSQTEVLPPNDDAPLSSEGIGSNNFAVAGSLTEHGGAILANDMHLGLRVPNIWYRAEVHVPGRRIVGVSLPGTPAIVVGSNGDIAWGFTNSYGDWLDFIRVPADSGEVLTETIEVRGADPVQLQFRQTEFGPITEQASDGAALALRWTAHSREAINMRLMDVEQATTVDAAVAIFQSAGMPVQNALIADRHGNIAWTPAGRLPVRPASDATQPLDPFAMSFVDTAPVLGSPDFPRLWSANARVVDEPLLGPLGDGGYTIGARAMQIRDGLFAREKFDERDLLAIQLDDRALFLDGWRQRLAAVLAADPSAELQPLRDALGDWNGRAAPGSRAYRAVRAFRLRVHKLFLAQFEGPLRRVDEKWSWPNLPHLEEAVEQALSAQPRHLLARNYADWNGFLRSAALDVARDQSARDARSEGSWGAQNATQIRHPLSRALPGVRWLLDMPSVALPGDQYMPRVQGPAFGASERLVVSPGREESGIFHMPGGQSGHPLSPFYGAGHEDWEQGRASPLLAGPALHRLTLRPAASR